MEDAEFEALLERNDVTEMTEALKSLGVDADTAIPTIRVYSEKYYNWLIEDFIFLERQFALATLKAMLKSVRQQDSQLIEQFAAVTSSDISDDLNLYYVFCAMDRALRQTIKRFTCTTC